LAIVLLPQDENPSIAIVIFLGADIENEIRHFLA
jgi:hypothetical protein